VATAVSRRLEVKATPTFGLLETVSRQTSDGRWVPGGADRALCVWGGLEREGRVSGRVRWTSSSDGVVMKWE
jgi:hypothetical protein